MKKILINIVIIIVTISLLGGCSPLMAGFRKGTEEYYEEPTGDKDTTAPASDENPTGDKDTTAPASDENPTDDEGTTAPASDENPSDNEDIADDSSDVKPESANDIADDSSDVKPTNDEDVPGSHSYEKGLLTETGYESRYLDIRFTVPEGFLMATQDDINAMMNIGAEVVGLNEMLIDYANLATVYEMMVSTPIGTPNVVVYVEKLMLSNMTVEQYFEAFRLQLYILTELTEINYEFSDEIVFTDIAGQSYKQFTAEMRMAGQSLIQRFFMRKIDNRIVCITATYTPNTEEAVIALMQEFKKY